MVTFQCYIFTSNSRLSTRKDATSLLLPNNRFVSKSFGRNDNGSQSLPDHASNPIKENENKEVKSKGFRWFERETLKHS